MFNKEISCCIVDHCVKRIRVQSQRVVIVEAVDVHFSQVDLVVGEDGGGVEKVTSTGWNQVWEQMGNSRFSKTRQMQTTSDRQL